VYGAHYDLDAGVCETDWALEGTTVAPEFIVSALANGVPRCFAVTAVSVEGYESLWSPLKDDTPRPDARNVVVYARQYQDAGSGFRFWQDLDADGRADANELGLPKSGSSVASFNSFIGGPSALSPPARKLSHASAGGQEWGRPKTKPPAFGAGGSVMCQMRSDQPVGFAAQSLA